MDLQPRIRAASAAVGPLFVSIGDAEKLATFLSLNPNISPSQIFVEGYDFGIYQRAGFGSLLNSTTVGLKQLQAPNLGGWKRWWNYLTNVVSISPVEKGTSGIPEGVLRLGGTFVIRGDRVVFRHSDSIPGDHPDLEDVMAVVEQDQPPPPPKE